MRERSLGLRDILIESLSPERVEKQYHDKAKSIHISDEEREQLLKNLESERTCMAEFEKRRQVLLEQYAEMSEEDFEREYQEASTELEDIIARVERYSEEYNESRRYCVEHVDLDEIKNFDEFLEFAPMQFIPRKEEVGRILALAKQMHEDRIRRGEKDTNDPLSVVDIGGANGALGKLITDLAKENGLNIEYTIVDPDSPTVQESASFYENNPSLQFKEQGGEDFNVEQYRDSPEISELLAERNFLVIEGERKLAELQKVITGSIYDKGWKDWRANDKKYQQILKVDFGIEIKYMIGQKEFNLYKESWRKRVNAVTKKIELLISQQPARYDLVINSWMPVATDLTKEVTEANGAAIIYALEWSGATGCRSDVPHPESPSDLGQSESYHPGKGYQSRLGWISHSVPQAQIMMYLKQDNLLEYSRYLKVPPFANGFVVQTKNGYDPEMLYEGPDKAGIKVAGSYPWEDGLSEKGGDISRISRLYDRGDCLYYYKQFEDLKDEILTGIKKA